MKEMLLKRKGIRRVLSLVLCLAMCISLMPAFVMEVKAEEMPVIDTIVVTTDASEKLPKVGGALSKLEAQFDIPNVRLNAGSCYWTKYDEEAKDYRQCSMISVGEGSYSYNISLIINNPSATVAEKVQIIADGVSYEVQSRNISGSYYLSFRTTPVDALPADKPVYTVTVNKNDGTEPTILQYEEGTIISKPSEGTRAGYEFVGWYTDEDCLIEYDFSKALSGNLNLYAKWNEVVLDELSEIIMYIGDEYSEPEYGNAIYKLSEITFDSDAVSLNIGSCYWAKLVDNGTWQSPTSTSFEEGSYRYHFSILVNSIKVKMGDTAKVKVGDITYDVDVKKSNESNYYYLSVYLETYTIGHNFGTSGTVCEYCGIGICEAIGNHEFSKCVSNGDGTHKVMCTVCDTVKEGHDKDACSGGTATCTKKAVCEDCGKEYGKLAEHTLKTTTTKATLTADGKKETKCTVCGKVTKTTKIYAAKTVKLSKTAYTYDGKAKKPTVTIKDSKGKAIATSNYTVKYDDGRKNVGKYNVKITFKGDYKGSKTLTFTINPKATTLKSVTPASKAFTAKWTKQTKQVDGYEVEYALDKNFTSSAKKVEVNKNSTTSKKISSLKSKKTYYVRVRTYKKVGTKKYYSDWSKVLNVKTK